MTSAAAQEPGSEPPTEGESLLPGGPGSMRPDSRAIEDRAGCAAPDRSETSGGAGSFSPQEVSKRQRPKKIPVILDWKEPLAVLPAAKVRLPRVLVRDPGKGRID